MVLSAGDLASMRATMALLLPDTCTIQTKAMAVSTIGGPVSTYTDTYELVKCRAMRVGTTARAEMHTSGEQEQVATDWIITLKHDQAIALGDRIVLATLTLEPVDISDDESWKIGQRVLCRELRTG